MPKPTFIGVCKKHECIWQAWRDRRSTPELWRRQAMKGSAGSRGAADLEADQFPPLEELAPPVDLSEPASSPAASGETTVAMDRLTARQNASGEAGSSKVEGFEASVHRIKEQVLPRLLERVDPEAAATLNKDELAEEFRPIISEVLTELKINLNGASSSRWKRCWSTNCLASARSKSSSLTPPSATIMVNGPEQTYVERKGKLELAQIQFSRRGASVPDRPAHRQQGRPPHRPDQPALRRPPAGWQPSQRHRPAAIASRDCDLDP